MTGTLVVLLSVSALVVVFVAIRWRHAVFMALPFLVTLNGLPLAIRGSSVRLDQLAACVLLVPIVAGHVSGTKRLRVDATTLWLAAILATNVVASALNSPARTYSLLQCANLASTWLIYVLLQNFLDTSQDLDRFIERCLWAAGLASAIGIVAFALALGGVSAGGAEVSRGAAEDLTKAFGASGTMVEPNIFGSFTGAMFVLAAGLSMEAHRLRASRTTLSLSRWITALCAIGVVVSFTRSAWLGVLGGLAYVLVLGARASHRRLKRFAMPIAVGVALGIVLVLLPGPTGAFLRFKLANLVNFESRTATLRLLTYVLAIDHRGCSAPWTNKRADGRRGRVKPLRTLFSRFERAGTSVEIISTS